MPKVGTSARLYFPNSDPENAEVTGSVRENGGGCAKTGNPNNRYFGTEHGSELAMLPDKMSISGSKKNLFMSMKNDTGLDFTSHKKIVLNAAEEDIMGLINFIPNIVKDPVGFFKDLIFINNMLHPATANDYMMQQAVLGNIWNEIKTGFNDDFLHGDADSKGKYAGTAIWTAITLFNPEGKIGDLGKVDKVINVADKADEGEKLIKDGEKFVNEVTQADVKPMQLPEGSPWQRNVLNSFYGGKAVEKTYGGGTVLYRVGGKNGGFWSLNPPPLTEYRWRVDFAIKQEFCNDASTLYKITIPEGSSITGLDGIVGTQGSGLYGGAHQIYIDYKSVPKDWIEITQTKFMK